MIRISKLADYAILVMKSIATRPQQLVSAKDIALDTHISEPTVSKLLKMLTKHQLLNSERGAKGGYRLSATAQEITVAQIIEAIDGKIAITECNTHNSCCVVEANCTVSSNWQKIGSAIRKALNAISLADMMQQNIPESIVKFDFKKRIIQ